MALSFYTNTDLRLTFRIELSAVPTPVDLTGAEITMTFKRADGTGSPLVLTSPDAGVTIEDPVHGLLYADLTAVDTAALGAGLMEFDIIRTDGDAREPLAVGTFPILQGVS